MKTALQLNLGQQLTLTPQLQQAIRLLQLSTLDLRQEIQEAVEGNPMLEAEEAANDRLLGELASQSYWDHASRSNVRGLGHDDSFNYENFYTKQDNLHDHLCWQMQLTPMSATDEAIATAIIDSINDDGLLTATVEDIRDSVGAVRDGEPVGIDEVEAVLHRVQQFEPAGVAARDLAECLWLQLNAIEHFEPPVEFAKKIVRNNFELLVDKNFQQLQRIYRLSKEQLQQVLVVIQSLNPRPGGEYNQSKPEYVIPDIVVAKKGDKWVATLNPDAVPKVRINKTYSNLIQRANQSPDNNFLKQNLQDARWFLKSLVSRHDTLLRVAQSIVAYQQDFFEFGEEAMKPLVLHDIADTVDLHESTISRITTQKFMHTPRGVFELKYFFSSHVATKSGGECSSTAIRAIIKKLVAAENRQKPLSDSKIAGLLSEQGIRVARRTIAKYRESLGILASNERKVL
jgi:RNA polymerase sigma-54 factor